MKKIAVSCALLLCALLPVATPASPASSPPEARAAFTLEPLPYAANSLEPVIDEATMQLHHGKHHQAYVDALNRAVAADPKLQGLSLEALNARAGEFPPVIRNNAGGHWNHRFFWQSMTRPGQGGKPSPALKAAIDKQFGSMEAMKAAFKTAGTARFGSGWVWLIVDASGALKITSTPNQDNPLMDVAETKGTPILGNDVWEHAYYLKYNNRRGDYLDAWWNVVDWNLVSNRYAAAVPKPRKSR